MAPASTKAWICDACRAQLPLVRRPTCPRCAAPLPIAGEIELPCSHCREDALRFDRALALGAYDGLLRELVLRMKTDSRGLLAHAFAEMLWSEWEVQLRRFQIDLVAAVPMHFARRWRRGADPPQAMARKLAAKLGVAAPWRLLRQRRNIPRQMGLSRQGRFRNVHRQMSVRRGYSLQSARILVVDDVLTTGATCSEAARALKAAGAGEVTVVAVARTAEAH